MGLTNFQCFPEGLNLGGIFDGPYKGVPRWEKHLESLK